MRIAAPRGRADNAAQWYQAAGQEEAVMTSTIEGIRVVDADTHLTERHDLWTSRAPEGMKDRMPHVLQNT